jgi:hypothetical protein
MLETGEAGFAEGTGDPYGHHPAVLDRVLDLDRTLPDGPSMASTRPSHGRQSGHSRGASDTITRSTPAVDRVRMCASVAARATDVRTAISA